MSIILGIDIGGSTTKIVAAQPGAKPRQGAAPHAGAAQVPHGLPLLRPDESGAGTIGTTAVMACRFCNCETAVLTGFMSNLPQARECFDLFTRLHGIQFVIPDNATHATSIGAALHLVE